MTPILFSENTISFNTNGLGNLSEALTCNVTEELNGIYELEMTYPVTGRLFSQIVTSAIIYAEPYENASYQAFRIYRISKPMDGRISIYARHISYQTNWIPVMPFNYSSLADCFAKLKANSASTNPFTLWTNKTVATGHSFDIPQSFRACLGGSQGSVLQMYGGDYEWDNWTIKLWLRRGADNGVRIAYGKNLIDAKQEANIENTYTGVCPYWTDEETGTVVTLPEKYILAATASAYPFERIKTVDFSTDFDTQPTVAQLRARTNQYITANDIGYPNISIDVNFVALWQSEEYKDIAPLEQVQLGDTVTVDIERLGISMQSRVVEYTYDVLKGRYKSVTIGDAKSSFAKTFVDQGKAIEASLGEAKSYTGKAVAAAKSYSSSYTDSEVDRAIAEAEAIATELMENATNWLTSSGGYVVAVKNADGSWKELLFLDTPSTSTAKKVLRINENGIGFSSNGVNGTYKQAWTLDGKLVVGGTDQVTLAGVDASGKTIFSVDKSGISWLLQSSIMTKNGTLYFLAPGATASSGNVLRLNSSGICFGKKGYNGSFSQAWDMNGKLLVGGTQAVVISAVNGNNVEIFNVSKDGISWTMAQSIMKKNGTLYFLGNGAGANTGKVMRLSSTGIGFSKNGYNGTYTQSWTIDGQITIGGQDNKYGSLTVYDQQNRVIAELDYGNLTLQYYAGTVHDENYIDGVGMQITDTNDSDMWANYTISGAEISTDNGNQVTLDGAGLSLMNNGEYTFANGEMIDTPEITVTTLTATDGNISNVTADSVDSAAYATNGQTGITKTLNLPGGWGIEFENGIAVGYTRGASYWAGEEGFFIDGDHVYFKDGILWDVDTT